jgi:hypothetical protein
MTDVEILFKPNIACTDAIRSIHNDAVFVFKRLAESGKRTDGYRETQNNALHLKITPVYLRASCGARGGQPDGFDAINCLETRQALTGGRGITIFAHENHWVKKDRI